MIPLGNSKPHRVTLNTSYHFIPHFPTLHGNGASSDRVVYQNQGLYGFIGRKQNFYAYIFIHICNNLFTKLSTFVNSLLASNVLSIRALSAKRIYEYTNVNRCAVSYPQSWSYPHEVKLYVTYVKPLSTNTLRNGAGVSLELKKLSTPLVFIKYFSYL